MELSATLNTESMVKQKLKTLVHCVTYLHTFMHAEPDRSTFLIILHIIKHVGIQLVIDSWFRMQLIPLIIFLQTLFILKRIIILIKVLERPKSMGKP